MSRHRNVRSMNYSDEYDGYDDVYGHSVEDEYCISPSDEAQFMYDRTRQPQISAFFSEKDNITEEDENVDQPSDRKNSDQFTRPTLSDLDEAKLRSCLEEIRNVIGDSISERVLVETVLKCNFDVNKSLDTILSNATSSNETVGDVPKPQRVRRDRDRDLIHFQSNLLCVISHSDVNQMSENNRTIELQESEQILCQGILYSNEIVQNGENEVYNELNRKQRNVTCDNSGSMQEESICCELKSKSVGTVCSNSLTSSNIPLTSCLFVKAKDEGSSNEMERKDSCLQGEDLVQRANIKDTLRQSGGSPGECPGQVEPAEEMTEQNKLCGPASSWMASSEDGSSDEDCVSSPLVVLAKQLSKTASITQMQKHEIEPDDHCQAFRNLTIREDGTQSSECFVGRKKGILNVEKCRGSSKECSEDNSPNTQDNTDEKKNTFSPLAVLASRHCKLESAENCFSGEDKQQSINTFFSNREMLINRNNSGANEKCFSNATGITVSEVESFCGDKEKVLFVAENEVASTLLDKSSDDEENAFSPLAALADKYSKGKGDTSSVSIGAQAPQQKCSLVSVVSNCEEVKETTTINLCKSECNPLCDSTSKKTISGFGEYKCATNNSSSVYEDRDKELNLTQDKPASSLSDLAFFHLTRSASTASCGMKVDCELTDQKFHSDSVISKSVPGGFVIPFLKQGGGFLHVTETQSEKAIHQVDAKEELITDANMDSPDEWIIDLSNAIRDPELRLPCSVAKSELPAQVIVVGSSQVQEETTKVALAPCEMNARGMLKMKFSCTKRRCSPFGSVLCRNWKELARPYISPTKQGTGTVAHFPFNTLSPDEAILFRRNMIKRK